MTLDVYRGRKTTQQQHNGLIQHITVEESTGKCISVCPGLQMGTTFFASWLPSWSILPFLKWSTLKEKNLLRKEQILILRVDLY